MSDYITFPCEGKRPCIAGWNVLEKPVAHDESQNYGILCGAVNNLTVIDCDLIKDKETLDKFMCGVEAWNVLSKEYLSDKTKIPTVQTKTGGLHLYFRYNGALPSGIQRVSGAFFDCPEKTVKIDVLSDKKYVIGSGSAGYTFIEGRDYFENPPELPNEIIEILAPVKKEKKDSSEQVDTAELGESGSKAEATSRPVSLQLLKSVVDGIPSSCADNYQDWLRVVWAIADTAAKNGYDALDLADGFSKRSKSKYKGRADVEKVYCQSNGSIAFGTLMQLSEHKFGGREDDDIESVNTQVRISDLKVFEELGHATGVKQIVENKDVKVISLELDDGSDKEILVYRNYLVIAGSDFIGYIRDHVPLFGDYLSAIHPEFGNDPSRCLPKDKDTIEFVYRTEQSGEHRIRVKHPWNSKNSYLTKYSNNKQVGKPVSTNKTLEILIDALETGCRSLLKERYNITIYNNGGDVINSYSTARDEEKPARLESALIQTLSAGNPGIVDLFKFCDNGKVNNFDGLFMHSSVSGVWKKTHNARVERMLESRLKKYVVGLTESETRIIESHSNIQALRRMFVKEIYDDEFEEKVDENLNIFALLNGVYDLNLGALRRTNPQDYALTCTGWKYDKERSVKHMDEVVDFFRKILPIEEERHIVLTFIASLLHGHRVDKKFLVLTDKRSGNNGKSMLLALLRVFFGDYLKSSTKFFCKGHFDKNKDSHDAGLEPMKGKLIVLADEIKKSMRLDDALVKNLAGGHYVVEGRRIGVYGQFRFTWQAGIIMVFNEGDCPKFDPADTAFMERILVCPMRSKFISCEEDDGDSYTFRIDRAIHDNFASWCSSLLDYLAPFCSKTGLGDKVIPAAMAEWKDEVVTNNNDIGEWVIEHTESGNHDDFVSVNELRDMYIMSAGYNNRMSTKDFNPAAKALFVNKRYHTKYSHYYREDSAKKHGRNMALGLKMKI